MATHEQYEDEARSRYHEWRERIKFEDDLDTVLREMDNLLNRYEAEHSGRPSLDQLIYAKGPIPVSHNKRLQSS